MNLGVLLALTRRNSSIYFPMSRRQLLANEFETKGKRKNLLLQDQRRQLQRRLTVKNFSLLVSVLALLFYLVKSHYLMKILSN